MKELKHASLRGYRGTAHHEATSVDGPSNGKDKGKGSSGAQRAFRGSIKAHGKPTLDVELKTRARSSRAATARD